MLREYMNSIFSDFFLGQVRNRWQRGILTTTFPENGWAGYLFVLRHTTYHMKGLQSPPS